MKQRLIAIFVLTLSLLLSGCDPGQVFGLTITPTPTATPIPTSTLTFTPIPTETPTLTPTPLPTIAKEHVRVCALSPDGEPAGGAYIQVSDADYTQVFPTDGTTGAQTSGTGCLFVKLPPGIYHIRSQKVVNPFEGIYINGGADVEVVLGNPLKVEIELNE